MAFVLGMNCKLYRNTGTYGAPTLNEVPNVRDLSLSLDTSQADVTTRNNNGWMARVATLTDGGVQFGMVYNTEDPDFVAIRDQFLAKSAVEYFILDGSSSVSGTQGFRMTCMVTNFSMSQALTEAVTVDVSIVPTFATNAPSAYTVP